MSSVDNLYRQNDISIWIESIRTWSREDTLNIEKILDNFSIHKNSKNSHSSQTIILNGTINGINNGDIVIKCSFDNIDPFDNSLEVERSIYRNIISKLGEHTPNMIEYLYCKTYPSLDGILFSEEHKTVILNNIRTIDKYYTNGPVHLLYMRKSRGVYLCHWLKTLNKREDIKHYLSVIFQLLYTLSLFNNICLRHNDLHFRNIFVEELETEKVLYFNIDNRIIGLTTKYIPKIYDFDRGSYFGNKYNGEYIPRNISLDTIYSKYGGSNTYNPKFDLFTLVELYMFRYTKYIDRNIHTEFSLKILDNIIDYQWYKNIRRHEDELSHLLKNDIVPNNTQLKSCETILKDILNTQWTFSPFTILKDVPSDIHIFTSPSRLVPIYRDINPEIEEIPSNNITDIIYKSFRDNHVNVGTMQEYIYKMYQMINIWNHDIMDKYNRDSELLIGIVFKNKTEITPKHKLARVLYKLGCKLICSPIYHTVDINIRRHIDPYNILGIIISDIWNTCREDMPTLSLLSIDSELPVSKFELTDMDTSPMCSKMCLEYIRNRIYKYHHPLTAYWNRMKNIDTRTRLCLIDNIFTLCFKSNISHNICHLAIYILDTHIKNLVEKGILDLEVEEVHGYGLSSILVASDKYNYRHLDTLLENIENNPPFFITRETILECKAFLSETVNLDFITSYDWILFLFKCNSSAINDTLGYTSVSSKHVHDIVRCIQLVNGAIADWRNINKNPAIIAISAYIQICKTDRSIKEKIEQLGDFLTDYDKKYMETLAYKFNEKEVVYKKNNGVSVISNRLVQILS